jgi:phosphocarrier protein HPr
MIQRRVTVANRLGLHARAAAKLVGLANRFKARVTVSTQQMAADAKSILGVLTLAAGKNTQILLEADGPDEQAAIDEIAALIDAKFGEE